MDDLKTEFHPPGFPPGGVAGGAGGGLGLAGAGSRGGGGTGQAGRGRGGPGGGGKSRVILIRDPQAVTAGGQTDPARLAAMLDEAMKALFDVKDPREAWRQVAGAADVVGFKTNVWTPLPTPPALAEAVRERLEGVGLKSGKLCRRRPRRAVQPGLPEGDRPGQRPADALPPLVRPGHLHQELHHVRARPAGLPPQLLREPGRHLAQARTWRARPGSTSW